MYKLRNGYMYLDIDEDTKKIRHEYLNGRGMPHNGRVASIARRWNLHENDVEQIVFKDQECREAYQQERRLLPPLEIQIIILTELYMFKKQKKLIMNDYKLKSSEIEAIKKLNPEAIKMVQEAKKQMLGVVLQEAKDNIGDLKKFVKHTMQTLSDTEKYTEKYKKPTKLQDVLALKEVLKLFEDKEPSAPAISPEEIAAHDKFVSCF
jgi:hypothetical protein